MIRRNVKTSIGKRGQHIYFAKIAEKVAKTWKLVVFFFIKTIKSQLLYVCQQYLMNVCCCLRLIHK